MKCLPPFVFYDGEPFRRRDAREHVNWMRSELEDINDRRWYHSSFVLDFGAMATGDDAEEGVMYVQPPTVFGAWEVVAAEFMVAKATATSRDYTLTVSDGSTSKTITNTVAAADTLTRAASAVDLQVAANTQVSFTVSGFATEALTACKAVIHIRSDRLGGSVPTMTAGSWLTIDNASSQGLPDAIDSFDSAVDTHNTATRGLRIQVLGWRDPGTTFAAEEDKHNIPATGSKLDSCTGYAIRDGSGSGERITATIKDEGAATIATVNIDPTGATSTASSSNVDINDTQGNDDPTDANDDYTIDWTEAGTGDIKRAYVVLYWET